MVVWRKPSDDFKRKIHQAKMDEVLMKGRAAGAAV
jgi:hypothetical protein